MKSRPFGDETELPTGNINSQMYCQAKVYAFKVAGLCSGVTATEWEIHRMGLFGVSAEGAALIFCPGVKAMTNGCGDFSRLAFGSSRVAAGSPSTDTLLFIFGLSEVIIHIDRLQKRRRSRKKTGAGGEKSNHRALFSGIWDKPLSLRARACVSIYTLTQEIITRVCHLVGPGLLTF